MQNFIKYVLDYVLACLLLIPCAIIFLPCMTALWLTGEHKVWYRQKRIGLNNHPFKIIKFATMMKNSSKMGTGSLTLRNDPRVLPLGRFLRKTKTNELPQLFNVLNGTMSMVGPRPQMEIDFYRFPKHVQNCIYNVKPGITGIGSIIFRDEEKYVSQSGIDPIQFYTEKIAPYKGEVEIWYQKNVSILTDLKLIFLTAWVVLSPNSQLVFKWFKSLPPKPEWLD